MAGFLKGALLVIAGIAGFFGIFAVLFWMVDRGWIDPGSGNKPDAPTVATAVAEQPIAPFTREQICRAAIATLMGQRPTIVKVTGGYADVVNVVYARPGDGKKWANRCRLEGSRVMWASDPGRWRTDPLDEVVTFGVSGDTLTIRQRYSDGSEAAATYSPDEI